MGVRTSLRSVARFAAPTLSPGRRRFERAANIADLRDLARRRLPKGIFDYIDGGAEDETTLRANSEAFSHITFSPRVLRDVSDIDTSVTLLGHHLSTPIVFSPTGFTRIAHPEGEVAVARVAARHGLPYCLSTLSTRTIEDVAAASDGPKWFQVYVWRDRAMVRDMLQRAAANGYGAIMITVDTAVLGRRERDVRRGFTLPPVLGPSTVLDGLRHPRWTWNFVRHDPITFATVAESSGRRTGTAVTLSDFIAEQFDPSLSWDDIGWFRDNWSGPIIVKGIQSPADAVLAVSHGIDAIALSNHGGRQLDGAPTPVGLLPRVRDAVGPQVPLICDGGIRRGGDIVKALALGANACTMGRTYLWGLGSAGEAGVERALGMLTSEMVRTMQLNGLRRIDEIDRDCIDIDHGSGS